MGLLHKMGKGVFPLFLSFTLFGCGAGDLISNEIKYLPLKLSYPQYSTKDFRDEVLVFTDGTSLAFYEEKCWYPKRKSNFLIVRTSDGRMTYYEDFTGDDLELESVHTLDISTTDSSVVQRRYTRGRGGTDNTMVDNAQKKFEYFLKQIERAKNQR